ncbi:MAG: TonB-dependent receptor [Melioribacteraceae bacterium]|nr:TonB-dependent receptor [Melioribacteraceae bacterium]MCF8355466.1 TonB-dependent receptor [Melioribacteraceae bacterium]MCF8392557.1 TonB-dependent receptor [Melioribacteraceae bacterium]MCF8418428.1 TonB-dependent receptor [Melioribacteraceae bacterium]
MKSLRILFSTTLTLFVVTLLSVSTFAAGGKITGKITDTETGELLLGVNVLLEGTSMGAASDVNGEYFILNIPPGKYNLIATMVGYKRTVIQDIEVSQNHTTEVNIEMHETVMKIDEDIVVVADRPLVERDQTSTRHFVDSEEISTRPTSQLMEILTTLPGIDQNPGGELVVRRGTLDQVAFLIDGVRARNPLDFQPYTNVNLSSIQELEIITGGFDAEYGEAQSGVFNIVTKEGSNKLQGYTEFRYTPPGLNHWGTAFYDYSTDIYWENSHARHLQWWIDNPDQWVDDSGIKGNDPSSIWTPQEAYENYMQTHQPLNDYTERSGYQAEMSIGGPTFIPDLFFFASGKYRTDPPITGNSYRNMGEWLDISGKITYKINSDLKLMLSGFYSDEKSGYGMDYLQLGAGLANKYAYYDFAGFPTYSVQGQSIKLTHLLSRNTFYELQFNRIFTRRAQSIFPDDPYGWEDGSPVYDNLRAVDSLGSPIDGGHSNIIGLNTTGYYYRGSDENTDYTFSGDLTSQINQRWQLKTGFDLTYYNLKRYQQGKAYEIVEDDIYNPYEGDIYAQSKLEFEGLIVNVGLRYDFYNPNDYVYLNPFDPFGEIEAFETEEPAEAEKEKTKIEGQLSPRIGISHPISENTVLHFSYGHFFQRAPFGNYGEGTGGDAPMQNVTGILNSYLIDSETGVTVPYNLGNRNLKPRKTVAYEIGIEHNFAGIVTDITGFYKDITNNIRTVRVFMSDGNSYLTTGNSDYADAKGVEISLRKPLSGFWGGYLNYSWSTGIVGRSGDPDVIAAPNSGVQTRLDNPIGDDIQYDPPRMKFGLVFATPKDFNLLGGVLSNMQFSIDYQIYYPHEQLVWDNFSYGGKSFMRPPDKNADLRIRKEINILGAMASLFVEVRNVFNDTWINLQSINSATAAQKDIVAFVNSGFNVYPERKPDGGPFPDQLSYRNLPRRIIFGFALGF